MILRLASLGDILQTTHVLPPLKEAGYEIHFLVSGCCDAPLKNNPFIDRIHVIANWAPRKKFYKNTFSILKILFLAFRYRYHALLMFHINRLYPLLFKIGGVRNRIGFYAPKRNTNPFLTTNIPYAVGRSVADNNHALLQELAPHLKPNYRLSFQASEDEKESARKILGESIDSKEKMIFSCPGGATNQHFTMLSKRWPAEHFGKLYGALAAKGYRVILVGGKTDFPVIETAIKAAGNHPDVSSHAGKWNIRLTGALFSHGSLYIGNDSAPLYLAAAAGIPTLGIFGPTSGEHFQVKDGMNHFVQGKPGPCAFLTENPFCHFPTNFENDPASSCLEPVCMTGISVDSVLSRALDILERRI